MRKMQMDYEIAMRKLGEQVEQREDKLFIALEQMKNDLMEIRLQNRGDNGKGQD